MKGVFIVTPAITDMNQLLLDQHASLQVWQRENGLDNSEVIDRAKRNLKKAMEELLTPKQRTYLLMYYFEELTMEEIGERHGVKKSTVCRTIKRAKSNLQKVLRYSF